MKIIQKEITSLNNKKIALFRLTNSSGAYIELINYGGTLVSIVVPDANGVLDNCILRYNRIEDYFTDAFYLGSTVGRFANRISGAKFDLSGQSYYLDKNDGQNSNHGGFNGFNQKVFDYEISADRIIFSLESEDKEGGFPGNLRFSVDYSFSQNNEVKIIYKVISDRDTIFNPTNHAYFNLSPQKGTILDHQLKVFSKQHLEMNDQFLPTGKINGLYQSAFDFGEYRKIGEMAKLKTEIIPGYNSYFIGKEENGSRQIQHLASLKDNGSRKMVDVYSTMPGIQIYTGDYLSKPFSPYQGICLEAQFYPDAPNQAHFPSTIIQAGKEYIQETEYKFHFCG